MLNVHNPRSIAAPIGTYSHGIEVPPGARWLYVAGQIGVRPDGSVPATIEEQTELVWQNILAVLADAGMGIGDVVKITSFLTRHENFPRFAQVRAKFLGSHRLAEIMALPLGTALLPKECKLFACLHAFRHDSHMQTLAHADQPHDDAGIAGIRRQIAHE